MKAEWSKKDVKGKIGLPFGLMKCQQPHPQYPKQTCGGALIWRREDIFDEREVLTCTQCQHQLDQSEIMITRNAQQHRGDAPDILFTTTEMLNLQMNSTWSNHLFGVGEGYGPTLVLLDEVHTYSGTTGAQTRCCCGVGCSVPIVCRILLDYRQRLLTRSTSLPGWWVLLKRR